MLCCAGVLKRAKHISFKSHSRLPDWPRSFAKYSIDTDTKLGFAEHANSNSERNSESRAANPESLKLLLERVDKKGGGRYATRQNILLCSALISVLSVG